MIHVDFEVHIFEVLLMCSVLKEYKRKALKRSNINIYIPYVHVQSGLYVLYVNSLSHIMRHV